MAKFLREGCALQKLIPCGLVQLKSIDKMLEKLQSSVLDDGAGNSLSASQVQILERIEALKQEKAEICFH